MSEPNFRTTPGVITASGAATLQRSSGHRDQEPGHSIAAPLEVCYVDRGAAQALLNGTGAMLGVVGYGTGRPDFLPAACPFVEAPLRPATGDAIFEIWTTPREASARRVGDVVGACTADWAFGAITLREDGRALEAAVRDAYLGMFDFLDATGFTAPIRFWNYLTAITEDENGLERYRRFNIGRHDAFAARLRQPIPPAASAVGGQPGESAIYFLAAREPARPVENPRQVSAYDYPAIYGPRSPGFSRASIHAQGVAQTFFVSGTASIVGHETRHRGDLARQVAETLENLRILNDAAEKAVSAPLGDRWAFKIYVHHPLHWTTIDPAIDAAFGHACQRLYLRADMCRSELLVEIEAIRHFGGARQSELTADNPGRP